jgi:pilus assembly protein Flp/PilA
MKKLMASVKNFLREEDGVTAIEYGLIAALIAVACVVIWGTTGTALQGLFTTISASL